MVQRFVSEGKSIVRNAFWMTIAEGMSIASGFFVSILLARSLGTVEFGRFIFIFSYANLFLFLIDFGFHQVVTREIAREQKFAMKFLGHAVILKIFTISAAFGLSAITLSFLNYSKDTEFLTFFALAFLILTSFSDLFRSYFRAVRNMIFEALSRGIHAVLLLTSIAIGIFFHFSLKNILILYLFAGFIGMIITSLFLRSIVARNYFRVEHHFLKYLFKESWPFAFSAIFVMIYYYIDSVMLAAMKGEEVVGWYGAAYKIILFFIAISGIISNTLFPYLSHFYIVSKERFLMTVEYGYKFLIILAIPLTIATVLLSKKIVLFLYGSSYEPSTRILQILIWSVTMVYTNAVFASALSTSNRQRVYLAGTILGAISNIILNLILIPRYSYSGAAWATVITEMIVSIFMMSKFLKKDYFPFWKPFFKISVSAAMMGGFLWVLRDFSLFVLIAIGLVVYFGCYVLLGGWSSSERKFLIKLLRRAMEKRVPSI